jgi:hypothetical protein
LPQVLSESVRIEPRGKPIVVSRAAAMWRIALTAALAVVLIASPAAAVVPPTPDGNGHPNVGLMVAEWQTPGVKDGICSGTLIAPRVFLTAAHCDPLPFAGVPRDQVWVSFDPVYQPGVSTLYHGTFVPNPEFATVNGEAHRADLHDDAIIRLDQSPPTPPAVLPRAGLLSTLDLRDKSFVAVGYGATRIDKTKGPNNIVNQSARNVITQHFRALLPTILYLMGDPSTGDNVTCFGDSGGPHFLADSNLIVSITSTGDYDCRASDMTYRLDTTSARRYLASQGIPLP